MCPQPLPHTFPATKVSNVTVYITCVLSCITGTPSRAVIVRDPSPVCRSGPNDQPRPLVHRRFVQQCSAPGKGRYVGLHAVPVLPIQTRHVRAHLCTIRQRFTSARGLQYTGSHTSQSQYIVVQDIELQAEREMHVPVHHTVFACNHLQGQANRKVHTLLLVHFPSASPPPQWQRAAPSY